MRFIIKCFIKGLRMMGDNQLQILNNNSSHLPILNRNNRQTKRQEMKPTTGYDFTIFR